MRKLISTVAVAMALVAGLLAFTAVNPLASAGAQEDDPPPEEAGPDGRAGPLSEALSALVEDGTLTEEQAEAVRSAVREELGDRPFPGRHGDGPGRGGPGRRGAVFGAAVEVAADVIGVGPEAVREALGDRQSIADVAEANDVDPADVVEALVGAGEERLREMAERVVNATPGRRHGD